MYYAAPDAPDASSGRRRRDLLSGDGPLERGQRHLRAPEARRDVVRLRTGAGQRPLVERGEAREFGAQRPQAARALVVQLFRRFACPLHTPPLTKGDGGRGVGWQVGPPGPTVAASIAAPAAVLALMVSQSV